MNLTSSRSRSKPHFFNYKKPYMVHFQNTQKSHREKPKIHKKKVNKKGGFHKTPSSHFYLIETFSSSHPLSLKFLITCLLIVIDLTDGNLGQKSSLGAFCFKVFILASFFLFCLFLVLILFLCVVQVYACFLRLVLQFFLCSKHVWLLESSFLIMIFFLLSASGLGFSNNSHTCMP